MLAHFSARDPDQIQRARTVAAAQLERWPDVSAFLGGSPMAGLGTPASDVDLFVVHPDSFVAERVTVDDARVDVEFVTYGELESQVEDFQTYAVSETDASQLQRAGSSVLDRLVRFLTGEIVRDVASIGLGRLQSRALAAESSIRHLVIARHSATASNCAEDAIGAGEIGDVSSRDYQARETLLRAAKAVLAARGDLFMGTKWVWAQWDRSVGSSLGDPVSSILRDPGAAAATTLTLSQDLLVHSVIPWTYPILCTESAEAAVRRASGMLPFPISDAVLLTPQLGKPIRVSLDGAFLWGAAHGRTRSFAVDYVAQTLGVERDRVDACYATLLGLGALVG